MKKMPFFCTAWLVIGACNGGGSSTGDGQADPDGRDPQVEGDGTPGDGIETDPSTDPDAEEEAIGPDPHVSGELRRWHPLTLTFDGPEAAEHDVDPNPFLDFRLQVLLTSPTGAFFSVPGFFDGDGSGGPSGGRWSARFTPDESGAWSYEVSFRRGSEVAVSPDPGEGTPLAPDGTSGVFLIEETDKEAPDFRATGRIVYGGTHYLGTQDGNVWIKGGTDSPENFLGYAGFEGTVDQEGGADTGGLPDGLHTYEPHVPDWSEGDPDWNDGAGRGIVGALNYLGEARVNSIYFLPCNLGGDGRETYPYLDPADLLHIDLGKVDQWNTVLAHAQTRGIALHVVLNETEDENENLHDGGALGVERKLYYRELIARFGHHPGLFWNLGEENDYGSDRQIEFAAWIRDADPYDHPITVHTHVDQPADQYDGLVGDPHFELASIQLSPERAGEFSETWRQESADAGRPWAVMLDEIGHYLVGVTDTNAAEIRRLVLWPAYLSGAGGVEWYCGYFDLPPGGDVNLEDFRTRAEMWLYTWIARQFMQTLPVVDMEPADGLLGDPSGQVFALPGEVYALYLPDGGETTLDLSGAAGVFDLHWYDVETGDWSDAETVEGGGVVDLPVPAFAGDVAGRLTLVP